MAVRRAFANSVLLLILALGLATSLFFNFRSLSEIRSLQGIIDEYALREKILEKKVENLQDAAVPGPDWSERASISTGDPREEALEDLLSRKDLLPWEGVVGGTMRIPGKSDIWFLGPSWCMAYIEDGHIGGYMLLSYEITGPGRIRWKLLDAAPLE